MSARLIALVIVTILFGILTALALMDVGYLGVLRPHFQSWGGAQVFADLAIVCVLSCLWMGADARQTGMNPWPFIVVTIFMGSFGPLLYLAARELRATKTRPASA
jgi:hypothetical protein